MLKSFSRSGSLFAAPREEILDDDAIEFVIYTNSIQPDFLTTREVAKILRVSVKSVERYRRLGQLPSIKINQKRYIYLRRDVQVFLSNRYARWHD